MSVLEKEIIERFRLLPAEGRARVFETLRNEVDSTARSLDTWLKEAKAARFAPLRDSSGYTPTVSELVNDVREKRDADIPSYAVCSMSGKVVLADEREDAE